MVFILLINWLYFPVLFLDFALELGIIEFLIYLNLDSLPTCLFPLRSGLYNIPMELLVNAPSAIGSE